ncbi:MAG: hypothetical protein IPO88_27880 [Nannocystis sp.]|uniref:hypothetical protein n=1 Tax=Nannocystis sp. TaxID=1962667 RepID=UPI002420E50A|nr:hypothetical protein [Nannocystis sp.]MBK9757250.1 hypothetical protein [Nannocystis sp.]
MLDGFFAFAQAFYEVTYTNISRICLGVEPSSRCARGAPGVRAPAVRRADARATHLGLGTHLR